MQQNDETRFEDFVGLISGLYKEIQRIKTSEGARLGLKGSDVMCLYYLERSKDGLTGADLARMAGVTRAAVSRTLAHLEEGGYVEVDDSGDAAVKYRAPVRLTALGGESMSEADRIIREVL
ncbi:MAG: helix-turn-helix domain-containing protein, partial [Collinsella sp.]|nr:helix-turn-helix domain-containing protein [Collinsella sp.]